MTELVQNGILDVFILEEEEEKTILCKLIAPIMIDRYRHHPENRFQFRMIQLRPTKSSFSFR